MTESSSTSTPPGREPPSGHADIPSQSGANDPQGRDTADDAFDAGQGENDVTPPLAEGGTTGEHGEIEQAPGPGEGERTGASDIAEPDDEHDGGVGDDEPTPGAAPADPVDEGDAATEDPNESGEPEPGETDPTQHG